MKQVLALEVRAPLSDGPGTIYPAIIKDSQEMILVDCGHPRFLPRIRDAAEAQGIDISQLTKIVITHHDFDHMGALAEFKSRYPDISVVSSEIEEKYISGKEKSLRLQQAEAIYDSLPEEQKAGAEVFHRLLKSVRPVEVDITVADHQVFPWCGGTEIVATPGHMPGHIAVYVRESRILIAGDALVVENGELGIANPKYTLDMETAKMSVRKLLDYDIERVICYHGGVCTSNIKASLRKMLQIP